MTENWIIELFCIYIQNSQLKIKCQLIDAYNKTFNKAYPLTCLIKHLIDFFSVYIFFIDDEQYATSYVYDNVFDCIFDYNNRSLS